MNECDGFVVEVFYVKDGVEYSDRYFNKQIHSCVRATKRKRNVVVTGTRTRDLSYADKCIPSPPPDFKFASFPVKQKRNRFGRLINEKPD
jgi:hypothetical protein